MPKWDEITRNEKYQNLPPEARAQIKTSWFETNLLPEIEKRPSLKEMGVDKVYQWFMQQPDDTGQGYVSSMLGAAGRGFGEVVPGAIEGVGALTGLEGLRETGQELRSGLESISPVNPIYAESVPVKLAGVGGQIGSVVATAGTGGLAGKVLGGVGAVSKGAKAASLGSAFLQGAAEGAREAEQYGMTGPEAYLRTLAGGATEAGTELLPFGMAAETALAKRVLAGTPRTGTFLGATASEGAEESLAQIGSNIATKLLAPVGVETPDITAGALEAGLYGAAGGAMLGGVNALISTPPERQTQIQKDLQAEAGAIPKDTVPDQTNEEKLAAMEAGGTTVVDPDGKTAVILPQQPELPSMPSPDEVAVQLNTDAAKSLEATGSPESAKAQAGFDATLKEILPKTSQPTIQPEQAAAPAVEPPLPPPNPEFADKSDQELEDYIKNNLPTRPMPPPFFPPDATEEQKAEIRENFFKPRRALLEKELRAKRAERKARAQKVEAPTFKEEDQGAVSMPMMVTRDMKQQLVDLGYSKTDINSMRPEEAVAIIKSGVSKKTISPEMGMPPETPPPVAEVPLSAPPPVSKQDLLILAKSQPVGTKFTDWRGDVWEKVPDGWTLTSKQFVDARGVETTRPMTDKVAAIELPNQLLSAPAPVAEVPPSAPAPRAATRPGETPPSATEQIPATAAIPVAAKTPPPTLTPEPELYAPDQVPSEESVYEKPQDRIEGREAEETSLGDRLLRPAEGEVKEEVMPLPEVAADPFAAAPLVDNLPALIAVRDNNATPEQVQSLVDQGLVEQVDGQNIITEAGVAAMPEDQRPKLTPAERVAEVEGMGVPVERDVTKAEQMTPEEWVSSGRKKGTQWASIYPAIQAGKPVNAELYNQVVSDVPEGYVKDGLLYRRINLDAPVEQMAPDEVIIKAIRESEKNKEAKKIFSSHIAAFFDPNGLELEGYAKNPELVGFVKKTIQPSLDILKQKFGETIRLYRAESQFPTRKAARTIFSWSSDPAIAKAHASGRKGFVVKSREIPINLIRWIGNESEKEFLISNLDLSILDKKPITSRIVNTYGITLPEGYVKQGDLYVFQPTAAEMPTPDSVAVEPGATRGVQPEPVGGSILTVGKVSPETEISSRENLGPEVAAAEKKQADADEAAKKRQEKQDNATKNSLNSILDPQKKNAVTGTVTKADVETAREALTNSGEIPNAYLTNVYESVEAFLADKANARLFPSAYARLQTEKNIEGLYENGQTLIFAKQIQVSNLDRNLAKMLGITPEQAAARRVIAHENGHKAISLFTLAEKRELRGYLMRAYSDEQIAKLVETYDEYADWRTNLESRFEALEELLMRDFERMDKIPTGGVWDDIVQFLKRVWRRLTGQKGEPTLKNLKDVARLMRNAMKRPAVPLGSFTLKDGGKVKLSFIGEKAIENLPEERRQFMRDSLETAKAMAAAGKDSEEIRAATGWFPGKYDGKMRWEVPDEGAKLTSAWEELKESSAFGPKNSIKLDAVIDHPELFTAYPELADVAVSKQRGFFDIFGAMQGWFNPDANTLNVTPNADEPLSTILHEIQHWIQKKEGFAKGSNTEAAMKGLSPSQKQKTADQMKAKAQELIAREEKNISSAEAILSTLESANEVEFDFLLEAVDKAEDGFLNAQKEFGTATPQSQKAYELLKEAEKNLLSSVGIVNPLSNWDVAYPIKTAQSFDKLKSDTLKKRDKARETIINHNNLLTSMLDNDEQFEKAVKAFNLAYELYKNVAGEIEARDVQARKDLTPEQRAATAPYSSENIAPEDAIVMFGGGGAQMSMATPEMDAEYLAAVEQGDSGNDNLNQLLRDASPDERQAVVDSWIKRNPNAAARIQRMVDEAAKAAGYNRKGVRFGFYVDGVPLPPSRHGELNFGPGYYVAEDATLDTTTASAVSVSPKVNTTNLKSLGIDPERVEFRRDAVFVKANRPFRSEYGTNAEPETVAFINAQLAYDSAVQEANRKLGLPFETTSYGKTVSDLIAQGRIPFDSWRGQTGRKGMSSELVVQNPSQIKSANPVTFDNAGNVIPLSQRFQPTSPDIRFSRPQFASDTDAATSAGNEAARSTIYSERDMDVREAIRRAYEAMPKDTSVAVPIGDLFAKTKEMLPDVTQDEFSNVLQDLFEDNGAVLQEGDVVEPLTEQDRRYLALAEDEEANQEELQEMAVKVAKKSGFNVINVGNGITYEAGDEPDSVYGERDNVMSHGGTFGFYFSDNPTVWSDYAKPRRKGEKGKVNRTFLSLKNPFRFSEEFVSYDKLQALLRDGGVALPAEVKSRLDRLVAGGFGDTQPVWKWFHPTHVGAGAIYGESLKKAFTDAGYDGVIHPDSSLIEGGLDTPATSYVVFSPSQIKSADPVTRDDQGRIIPLSRRFDTGADIRGQINVTTPEGRRAGFVVVMPRAAKASKIRVEDAEEAAPTFKSNIDIASKGRVETDEWTGKNIKGVEVPEHNINAPELYMKAAIDLIKNLQGKGYSLIEISESLQDREFEKEIGLKDYDVDVIQKTRKALGFEVQMRMQNARKKTKIEREKLLLDKAIQNLGVYMASSATGEAQVLQEYQFYQNNPRYRFMVLENAAKKDMLKNAGEIVDAATGSADKIVDLVNTENKNATDAAVQQLQEEDVSTAEDDQDAIELAAGEATLNEENKSLWNKVKDWLREIGAAMNHIKSMGGSSKASISAAQRSEISKMSREEALAFIEDRQKKINKALKTLLGEESEAKTPDQKKTRQKREKMVNTAKKRAEAGKDIDVRGRIESLFPLADTRSEIIDEVGNALLKAAEQRKVKPKQRTAIQDFVSAIKQTLMANIKGDKLNADQPSLGMLLAKTFAQQGSEAKAFAESWANGRKKVREMLIEMGIEQENLNAELDAIMPPTPTLAYAPAAARRAVSNAMREIGLMRSDLLNDPVGSKKAIMDKFDEAAKNANLTEEGWDQKGRDLAEKAVDESIVEAKIAQERAKKVAKILSEQADKPVSLEEFGVKLAEFRFKKDKIVELFNRAKKLAEKKVQMANDQAIRVLFAAENKLAQSAFFNDAEKPDTIVKAFREQVEEPMDRDAFKKRMEKMLVTPEMADRLFDKAARERDNARWKKAQDFLEGPKARQNLLREMNKARPAGKTPLEQSIPWKTILSQNPETFEQYRQRIFDAISSIEDLQGITEEQKERLAELYAEALQEKRDTILDSLIRKAVQEKRRENLLGEQAEKAIIESTNKIIDLVNLGGFNRDDVIRVLGEKFGLKTDFTEAEKEKIQDLAEKLQNENLNPAKRNKLAMEFLIVIAGASDIPVTQILANFWTSNILFGPQTIFSIASAFLNGAYGITTIGLARGFRSLTKGDIKGAIEESLATLDGIGRYLSAFPSSFNRAWQYLWSGDIAFLSSGANDVLSQVKTLEDLRNFKNYKMLAENLAKDPSTIRRYVGLYLRFVSRLLTALDAFNIMVTQAGHTSIALRQAGLTTEKIKEAEMALDLEPYKKKIIEEEFEGKKPTTLEGKALLRSLAEAEMIRALNKLGAKMENADWAASESAMTMNPTGFGGGIYKAFTGTDKKLRNVADDFLNKTKKKWVSEKDLFNGLELALAYFVHFAAYQAANVAGYKFIRYASNKFNQGISYLPVIGLLRNYEKGNQNIKGKEAFMDSLYRNQMVSFALGVVGYFVLKAITDEPDDEKRNFIWNGGWDNLTPDQIKQKLSSGEKPYTIVIKYNGKGYVFNYQNWPWNQIGAAIGAMSDQIRFSPNQWNEKGIVNKMLSAVVSGTSAALEMPAVSQLAEVFGTKSIASKDPTEQALNKFNRIVSGWTGGFTPRMLKDFDFFTEPSLRKYEGLWEKTASQIPIYRRYVGEEYYDILGKQIEKNVIPGSREFMMKRTDPEYKILGALNARNIWLTPANAEYRMIGKGRNRRRLTQEEADAYSLETGRGYRDMLLRYGQRALQMPTERARAFLQDKAEEVRDRALKRAYRR